MKGALLDQLIEGLGEYSCLSTNAWGGTYLTHKGVTVLVSGISVKGEIGIRFEHFLPITNYTCDLITVATVQELWEKAADVKGNRVPETKTMAKVTPRAIQNLRTFLDNLAQAYIVLDELVSDERTKRARLLAEEQELIAHLRGLDASLKRGYNGSFSLSLHGLTAAQVKAIKRALG